MASTRRVFPRELLSLAFVAGITLLPLLAAIASVAPAHKVPRDAGAAGVSQVK
jgi:hypothetical protein